ncbi:MULTISPECIES: hypothetical protein [Mesorhizobium]|uniref:hypothetical protein n=1 Tax=Mesorhizobium TaxID=68287 RepID=UPI001FCDAEBB|nr:MULTISPECIES: hypothetical protein [Mesorhizobium]MDF3233758.1 hypothetical protein [Mesorhizobium sp. DSM 30133]
MNLLNGELRSDLMCSLHHACDTLGGTAMGTMYFDAEVKAELHSEAVKLVARYESPLETVKALMAYNREPETQILAIAQASGDRFHWLRRYAPCCRMTGVDIAKSRPAARIARMNGTTSEAACADALAALRTAGRGRETKLPIN